MRPPAGWRRRPVFPLRRPRRCSTGSSARASSVDGFHPTTIDGRCSLTTQRGLRRVGALYGPLVADGAPLLSAFTKDQLVDARPARPHAGARLSTPRPASRDGPRVTAGGQHPRDMTTLLDLLDSAVTAYGERPALGLRHDNGSTTQWDVPPARPACPHRRRGGCARSTSSPATVS